ncbi:MAG: TIGR01777 family protein [Gemmatimonadetes bacterium]|uniref:TIGR01777 family protein n=1 Tax=Candidatus Kutchimonas denitrificans TaxID=3056748 RepID=A0AAE4ZA98_9BACT|nr:TIGR01777 family protein [Gemmatimonadota bacterium]NIR74426.1 TIGR01777 family protein [Candidatus Kutchimonas denitrificans]NIS00822.1 TIGR01777 family protein [Gemmatimonadota bacterium]NIT66445.1 TIGR01777 family protein [Gemmatimonadota bacterium]NIU52076.1 TIGR01777 family protein [Gemmatimonadota bacterium]
MPKFIQRSVIDASAAEVFRWHARSGALQRLLPPWERIAVVDRSGGIEDGARTVLRISRGPLRLEWVAVHSGYEANRKFVDEQERGPFAAWRHVHRFTPQDASSCILEDEIEYRLPLGALGAAIADRAVGRDLERTFRFRHRRTADDLRRHAESRGQPRLRVAISGASGTIGEALAAFLSSGGHDVLRLVRRAPRSAEEVEWDPATGTLDSEALEGLDAAVHLSGKSLASWPWTEAKKRTLWNSRIESTRTLASGLAHLREPPRVLVSASAIGYYGDRGDEELTERAEVGTGFLADLCQAWEAAARPAADAGIRVVNPRIGPVITAAGGMLTKMLPVFKLGVGGVVGSGRQYLSWIALDDLLGAILHILYQDEIAGPVNVVSPGPVTNREFTRTLGRVLGRPTVLPLPTPAVKLIFGQLGRETLLAGSRVRPAALEASGFRFGFSELSDTLRFTLGRSSE